MLVVLSWMRGEAFDDKTKEVDDEEKSIYTYTQVFTADDEARTQDKMKTGLNLKGAAAHKEGIVARSLMGVLEAKKVPNHHTLG